MPQQWTVSFVGVPIIPERRFVHAVVARWFDGEEHKAPRKPWSLGRVRKTKVGFEADVRIFLDSLASTIAGVGGIAQLGREQYKIDAVRCASAKTWTDILDEGQSRSLWHVRAVTPLVFRSGDVTTAPTAGLVFGHLREMWTLFAPDDLHATFADVRLDASVTAVLDGHHVPVGPRAGWGRVPGKGFVGTVNLATNEPDGLG